MTFAHCTRSVRGVSWSIMSVEIGEYIRDGEVESVSFHFALCLCENLSISVVSFCLYFFTTKAPRTPIDTEKTKSNRHGMSLSRSFRWARLCGLG